MIWKLGALCGLIALSGAVHAANPSDRPVKLFDEAQATSYAHELRQLTQLISQQYVRDISENELLLAALRGLYDAARQPFPSSLADNLKNAKSNPDRDALLISARRSLGNVPAIEGDKALFASIQALPAVLDPHCVLVKSSDFQVATDYQVGFGFELDGESGVPSGRGNTRGSGFGAPPTIPSIPFRIAKVHPGGPAQRAGLRPGDVLTHVNGKAVNADSAESIYNEIILEAADVPNPKPHPFTVLREGRKQSFELSIAKRLYDPESIFGVRRSADNAWNHWLDEQAGIGYIRIGFIDGKAPSQLNEALAQLRNSKGLVLDLRWCPGGYLNQAAEMAAMFLESGKIAAVKYRQPDRQGPSDFHADGFGLRQERYKDVPMLVLVNGDTTGGGELIAGALQDNGRAKVAGQRTLGKASIQTPLYLANLPQYAFKLSAGTFVRPSGKNLQRYSTSKPEDEWGIQPDKGFEIPLSNALGQRLKDWHALYALRPPESREALPLDDPEADPQRNRAMRLLKDSIAK